MFEKQTINIPCPECGHKTAKTVAWIKAHDKMTCGGCGREITVENDKFVAGLKEADKAVAKVRKSLSRIGKRR